MTWDAEGVFPQFLLHQCCDNYSYRNNWLRRLSKYSGGLVCRFIITAIGIPFFFLFFYNFGFHGIVVRPEMLCGTKC